MVDAEAEEALHKELFESLSTEYLPALAPHDAALLDSLVEQGCEDNHILGQLASLVHHADYEDDDDMLSGAAPVTDIIQRLEQLECPPSAAQGLLHLQHAPDLYQPLPRAALPDNLLPMSLPLPTDNILPAELNNNTAIESDQVLDHNTMLEGEPEHEPIHSQEPMLKEKEPSIKHTPGFDTEPCLEPAGITDPDPADIGIKEEFSEISEQILENLPPPEKCDIECENDVENDVSAMEFKNESEESGPTDLSTNKHVDLSSDSSPEPLESVSGEVGGGGCGQEEPRDLSVPRPLPTPPPCSPRRAPSRESDAMQSPQPSGIPAVPSSPELFTAPHTKSKQTLFLETLLSSPSPKMYTSEVTITKQQCEPLNLGKNRKSASPTVSSCSDDIRKMQKEYGEPQEKRIRRESTEDIVKISKVFSKTAEEQGVDGNSKKPEKSHRPAEDNGPLKQLQVLKTSSDFNIPDPLLVPKDKLNDILSAPGREIPALLIQRPELRLPEAFAYPAILQDPDILVISLSQLENIIENDARIKMAENKAAKTATSKSVEQSKERETSSKPDRTSPPKPIPSMDALAGDIDAATSAALHHMLWLQHFTHVEAAMACSQNVDFLKAFNSSGYSGPNYQELSQMFNPASRFVGPGGFPMMPPVDYDNRIQFAMWQEAMNQANASRAKPSSTTVEAQMKELSKSTDVQNPYVHSTKNHQSKSHSAARTSPIAHNYNNACQRGGQLPHNPFLQGMYPGVNPNVRPNVPLPGLQIPNFNHYLMGNQRASPRTHQQKSPTSPYFPNNNYLQSLKQAESQGHQRSSSSSSESSRPRIAVRNLQNMMDQNGPSVTSGPASGGTPRRHSSSSIAALSAMGWRREEPEVGSTTPLGETPTQIPPHPHDPVSMHHLWHPLFGNQKGYNSPWSWTTVTATGD